MIVPIAPAVGAGEQRLLIRNVDWAFYRMLRTALDERGSHVRLTYDRGSLEITTTSPLHEIYKRNLVRMLDALFEELQIEYHTFGNMTMGHAELDRGLEPDECYYIQKEPVVRGKMSVTIPPDPPPDLAIEVELSRSALNKLSIYATLGVPEVWRFDGETLRPFLRQPDGSYREQPRSLALPAVPLSELVRFVTGLEGQATLGWLAEFRAWVRTNLRPAPGGDPAPH